MTDQEAFNLVWDWFIVQGQPLSHDDVACLYRGPNWERCAIGVLIPDDQYKPSIEGMSVCELIEWECVPALRGLDTDFADALADAHDSATLRGGLPRLKGELRNIARHWRLTVPGESSNADQ